MVANPVRGLLDRKRSEEHLPSSNESKEKHKHTNDKIHRSEKDKRAAFDRETQSGEKKSKRLGVIIGCKDTIDKMGYTPGFLEQNGVY